MFYDANSYGSTFKIPSINDGLNPNLAQCDIGKNVQKDFLIDWKNTVLRKFDKMEFERQNPLRKGKLVIKTSRLC